MTDSAITHLSEAERHGAADGTLGPELVAAVEQHLEACDGCAADVARIKTLMTRTRDIPTLAAEDPGELWPAIRARIEQDKVAALHERRTTSGERRLRYGWLAVAGLLAAGLTAVLVSRRNVEMSCSPSASGGAFSTLPRGRGKVTGE
jgi:anti-sigma factor RsiW